MLPDARRALIEGVVACYHHAPIAVTTQVLCREETESGHVAQGPDGSILIKRAYGLGSVFYYGNRLLPRDFIYGVHVRTLSKDVHGDDGPGLFIDGVFNLLGDDIEVIGVDVYENATGSHLDGDLCDGDE